MKIGILTFQRTTNYGAIMQCYALNKKINTLGVRCETIDYYNNKLSTYKTKNFLKKIYIKWKQYNCNQFINQMISMSKKVEKKSLHSLDYDCYIVGSDQVWNVDCTDNDLTYFIDFNNSVPKYTYAASIGLDKDKIKNIFIKYSKYINKFKIVSLRENFDKENLSLLNVKTRYDMDPVFLLSSDEWKKISSKRLKKQKYIFYYTIGKTKTLDLYVRKLAEHYNLKIVDNKKSIDFLLNCKPNDFISWIYNAEFVVTNSFHGTAFSIIFNKSFYTECDCIDGFNYRIFNLLKKYKLTERIVDENNQMIYDKIDFSNVNKNLKKDISNSIKYLNNIINTKK